MFFCQEQANFNIGYLGDPTSLEVWSNLKIFASKNTFIFSIRLPVLCYKVRRWALNSIEVFVHIPKAYALQG